MQMCAVIWYERNISKHIYIDVEAGMDNSNDVAAHGIQCYPVCLAKNTAITNKFNCGGSNWCEDNQLVSVCLMV